MNTNVKSYLTKQQQKLIHDIQNVNRTTLYNISGMSGLFLFVFGLMVYPVYALFVSTSGVAFIIIGSILGIGATLSSNWILSNVGFGYNAEQAYFVVLHRNNHFELWMRDCSGLFRPLLKDKDRDRVVRRMHSFIQADNETEEIFCSADAKQCTMIEQYDLHGKFIGTTSSTEDYEK